MRRVAVPPRHRWEALVESQGFHFHSLDDEPYWDESACYEFTAGEIDAIERATYALNELCLAAVQHVVDHHRELFPRLLIPEPFWEWVLRSWEQDERTIYGRFDLAVGGDGPPKLLEYNADTPTALLEAAVIQWYWLEDRRKCSAEPLDQFNSIHDRLIDAWRAYAPQVEETLYFTSMPGHVEDFMTVQYLRDTAMQAGIRTDYLPVDEIRWDARQSCFVRGTGVPGRPGYHELPILHLFKLYPWEWLIREPFGAFLPTARTRWIEAPWKMLLSNKALLAVLWELDPECPYLLRSEFRPWSDTYAEKPLLAREGAWVRLVRDGSTVAATAGPALYEQSPKLYQELHLLPCFDGRYPVVGSWLVNGWACGIGIREDASPITGNTSRFLPHFFRPSG